jgi:hypothetical protein
MSGNRTIDIRVMINDPVLPGSVDPGKVAVPPTSIDPSQGYMIVTAAGGVANQGTGNIAFEASAGDVVRFFATSGSNNFEQALLIQGIHHAGGTRILKGFKSMMQERISIAPASVTSVLPTQLVPRQFPFYQCEIARAGTESYHLMLAYYGRDEEGQPRFAGLYQWDPRITIHLSPDAPEVDPRSQETTP